jgi:hypothetical protein
MALDKFQKCYGHLVYFGFLWYIFPVLVCFTNKNLATLLVSLPSELVRKRRRRHKKPLMQIEAISYIDCYVTAIARKQVFY